MATYKLVISYDGTRYHGFQYQENAYTVQEALEKALKKLYREAIRAGAAGRTDAGVHARGQVVSFRAPQLIAGVRLKQALNSILPEDIIVLDSCQADENFLSRKDAKGKVYSYTIDNGVNPDVLMRNFSWHLPCRLDLEKMQKAARQFLGEHDFKAFQMAGGSVQSTVRTIYKLDVNRDKNFIILYFVGNGFLYKMVRSVTGTLVKVGMEKISFDDAQDALINGKAGYSPLTAPARGLCLEQVLY